MTDAPARPTPEEVARIIAETWLTAFDQAPVGFDHQRRDAAVAWLQDKWGAWGQQVQALAQPIIEALDAQAKRDREEADKYHGLLCIEIDRVKALRQQAQRTEAERAVVEAAIQFIERDGLIKPLRLAVEALRAATPEGRQTT